MGRDGLNKFKLLFVISILLVSGFLVTSLASYFVSRGSVRAQISLNELPLTSDTIYSEIQRDLFRPVFISSIMANDTFLRDWVIGGEVDEQKITRYLKAIQKKYGTFTSFFVSEKSRIYYHADGVLKKVSPDAVRDTWYFRVREMKDDYEVNVDPDMANKDAMTIFTNYRVFDYENHYIGATGVGLTVNAVKNLIESYQKKYNRMIYFVDRNGDVKLAGTGFDGNVRTIRQFDYFPLFRDKFDLMNPPSFSYTKNGQVIHTNIRYIEEFKWYLVVEQPERESIRQIFKTLVVNIVICVGCTLFILILVNLSVNAYQERIETLRGIVPICSFCKKIRDDKGYWNMLEAYVAKYTNAEFSHGICPDCMEKHYSGYVKADSDTKDE